MRRYLIFIFLSFQVCLLWAQTVLSGNPDLDGVYAREEFRIGVQAYNRFAFNEAILSFERALSFRPDEALIHEWLGRAYYRSGMEGIALAQWQAAVAGYTAGSQEILLLNSRIETVRNRRSMVPILNDMVRYVESGRYPGTTSATNITLFRQPTAVVPLEDGSLWVVAYGSNEIVRLDLNGIARQRSRGPLNGFDRPYDMIRAPDGTLYLSEYRGGRISVLDSEGVWQRYIGSKGQGDGQLIGPQNMCLDEHGYLYVVDYGNKRINKYDPDGTFVLSFGQKTAGFSGFISPTGIAAYDGQVYVADSIAAQIVLFDPNGAYRGVFIRDGLTGPESLRFLSDGRLLVADMNRIILIEPRSAVIRELGRVGSSRVRLTGAVMDYNGSILASNFAGDEVSILTRLDDMASGLFVQIDRVVSDDFPQITVELSVQDRLRRPVVGLDLHNFFLSEEGRPVVEQEFLGAGNQMKQADISILLERSDKTALLMDDLTAALRDVNGNLPGTIVSVVSAGAQPYKEQLDNISIPGQIGQLSQANLRTVARSDTASYTPRWRFDLGLRLAASDLMNASKKRAVVFVGSGSLGELSFEQYSLSQLLAYLLNNNIVFYAVLVGTTAPPSEELRYLCTQSGGSAMHLYRSEGIGQAIRGIAEQASGSYTLSYRSLLSTDFGRAYLPVEAEVYLMERSGRDYTGYFPPLE
ncbi:MAG: 6-bladed beta-propeller [Spirochaetaceae bacterium]|jgi:DNA-binding beta-propeller fold protein YncE|nr:6-bladed beta-propeller [Spirochaetaceae bacterium]